MLQKIFSTEKTLEEIKEGNNNLDEIDTFMENVNSGPDTLYFISLMKNKLDARVKRGSIVKALAIGSRRRNIEAYKKLLSIALEEYYDIYDINADDKQNTSKAQNIIVRLFDTIKMFDNQKIPQLSYFEKRVYKDIYTYWDESGEEIGLFKETNGMWSGKEITVVNDLTREPDELYKCSLKKLLTKFGDKTMQIYDAILNEKKILFTGSMGMPSEEIAEYVHAVVYLISPPLIGILHKLYPYAALNNLDFLEQPGFIAGVTNPMFKQRTNWYDLCCEIDTGKVKTSAAVESYESETYYHTDMELIQTILSRMKYNEIQEEEIRNCFNSYTQIVLDLTFGEEDFTYSGSVSENLANTLFHRIRRFKKTSYFRQYFHLQRLKEKTYKNGISVLTIENHIRKLKVRREIDNSELLYIFKDIKKFIIDNESIIILLMLLPKFREGLHLIALGLFNNSKVVASLSAEILSILEQIKVGKAYISNLNFFIIMQYHRVQNRQR